MGTSKPNNGIAHHQRALPDVMAPGVTTPGPAFPATRTVGRGTPHEHGTRQPSQLHLGKIERTSKGGQMVGSLGSTARESPWSGCPAGTVHPSTGRATHERALQDVTALGLTNRGRIFPATRTVSLASPELSTLQTDHQVDSYRRLEATRKREGE